MQLIDTLRAERARLEGLLTDLNEIQLTQRGVQENWSVKDIAAHITFWEQQMMNEIVSALRSGNAPRWITDPEEVDRLNAQAYAVSRYRSLKDVMADFRRSLLQLIKLIQSLSDDDLTDPRLYARTDDGRREPLWKFIGSESFGHYEEHIAPLRAWRQRLEAARALVP